jgi:hypothetical protein
VLDFAVNNGTCGVITIDVPLLLEIPLTLVLTDASTGPLYCVV